MSFLSSSEVLWDQPLRWILRQLGIYAVAAVVAATIFIIGAGVYSILRPMPEAQIVPQAAPDVQMPARKPKPAPAPTAPDEKRTDAMVVASGKEIGAPILLQGTIYGVVTEVRADADGKKRFVVVKLADGKNTIELPYEAVTWHSQEQEKRPMQYADEKVMGSVREAWGAIEGPVALPPDPARLNQ